MGRTKIEVVWKPIAIISLQGIYDYIWERSPQNAEKFVDQLIDFGDTLGDFPDKYAVCRHQKLKDKNFRCAVYKKNWVFIYKVIFEKVIIYNIIHAKSIS